MSEPKSINSKVSISAVIVVYNDYQSLSALIKSLCGQVDAIIVIDNSDADHVAPEFILDDVDIVYHRVGCNAGLGAGINKGIRLSEKKQSDWVLLLDQDSVVSENMTGCMMDEYYRSYEREKVGLICPDVFLKDKKSHQFPLRLQMQQH